MQDTPINLSNLYLSLDLILMVRAVQRTGCCTMSIMLLIPYVGQSGLG